ncbi:MAG: hypothetical protein HPY74_16300 [Firmicutes bacterium]|nr:hypothetical protein [Bacillota bacterium]
MNSVRNNAGMEAYDSIIKACGTVDEKSTTPNKQSKYVKAILHNLEDACGAEVVAKIMKPCGTCPCFL